MFLEHKQANLYTKIKEPKFISHINCYDIIFLSECRLNEQIDIDDNLINSRYFYKCFPRKSCKGGGLVLIYKKELHESLVIENIVKESILWVKLLNGSHVENNHFYIGFVYIPHENNVFYRKNELDLFSLLIEDISVYKEKGSVIVSGDFNSRIGTCPDFIENDLMGTEVNNFISNVIDYNCDIPMSTRESQDIVVNSFGRKLLDLCRSTCTRVCNGRTFGDKNGKYTFFNHLGASVNDFTIVSENDFHLVDYFCVEDFNEWSDHAPIVFHVSVNVSTVCNDAFSNTKTRFVRSKWENSLYNDVKIELCKHLEQLEQTLANVEGTVEGVNNCIESFTQILNNVFFAFLW